MTYTLPLPRLRLSSPLPDAVPIAELDLSPDLYDVTTTTRAPGGWATASVSLRPRKQRTYGFLPEVAGPALYQDVLLSVGGVAVHSGRITGLSESGGSIDGFESTGYGTEALQDDWFDSTDTTPKTAGAVLKQVISERCPLIGVSDDVDLFVDSGIEHTPAQFDRMMPLDIVAALATEGGSGATQGTSGGAAGGDNAPYDWLLYDADNRRALFLPRQAPPNWHKRPAGVDGAPYRIDFDADVSRSRDGSTAYGAVAIEYGDTSGASVVSPDYTDDSFADRFGMTRRYLLKGPSGITAEEAAQIAQTWLLLHRRPQEPWTITRSAGRGLRLAQGGELPAYLVKAGEWVQIADHDPVFILSTSYSWMSGAWTAQCAYYPPDYWVRLAQVEDLTRSLSLRLNPTARRSGGISMGLQYVAGSGAPGSVYEGGLVVRDEAIGTYVGGTWRYAPTISAPASATGTATGYSAGSTPATFNSDDTYDGGVGGTAFTINGLVLALKAAGIVVA